MNKDTVQLILIGIGLVLASALSFGANLVGTNITGTNITGTNISGTRVSGTKGVFTTISAGNLFRGTFNLASYSNLSSAKTALSGSTVELVIDKNTNVNNLTISSNIKLVPKSGALITVAAGKTLTLADNIDGGLQQIFAGDGTVTGLKISRPEWFGAVGTSDDTVPVQKALAQGGEVIFSGRTYTVAPITVYSNSTLTLSPATILYAKAGYTSDERLLNIVNCSNVVVNGNHGKVLMRKADYTTGEQRHGVFIKVASNVTINDLHSDASGGDGFYIGGNLAYPYTPSSNILLNNCYADNNRRQGLSIVSASDVTVAGGAYGNTTGTAPQYGIDVEPDSNHDTIENININGVKTYNNSGGGIILALGAITAVEETPSTETPLVTVHISNCTSVNDGTVSGAAGFRITGGITTGNYKLSGQVTITNSSVISPGMSGIVIDHWDSTAGKNPRIKISNVDIINPNTLDTSVANYDKSGVVILQQDGVVPVGNFDLQNITVYDNRAVVLTYSPVYFYQLSAYVIENFSLTDVIGTGFTPNSGLGHTVSDSLVLKGSISYSTPQYKTLTSSGSIIQYPGYIILIGGNGVYTLPSASTTTGLVYNIRNNGNYNTQIRTITGDRIASISTAAEDGNGLADLIMSYSGEGVSLGSNGTTSWVVKNRVLQGLFTYGSGATQRIIWGTAAPTTGTWGRGDVCINSTPASGQPVRWICTVTGTPGTWVSEGNLP